MKYKYIRYITFLSFESIQSDISNGLEGEPTYEQMRK